eukprot:TRINITY_DN68177_c0_g1_i1.p1 TRINITY_DN68177_c0_g1~~TRINITY_DN68177_c0_g1_i1.p1  ORF type:complete len:574 (+),score=86.50 TRINITY_DN68177_c0_g1_i1:112-1833(+)
MGRSTCLIRRKRVLPRTGLVVTSALAAGLAGLAESRGDALRIASSRKAGNNIDVLDRNTSEILIDECVPCPAGRAVVATGAGSRLNASCVLAPRMPFEEVCSPCARVAEQQNALLARRAHRVSGGRLRRQRQVYEVVRRLLAHNLSWSVTRAATASRDGPPTQRLPRTCFEALYPMSYRLAAWLFLSSPRWADKSLHVDDPEAFALYRGLEQFIDSRYLEFGLGFNLLADEVMAPASMRAAWHQEDGIRGTRAQLSGRNGVSSGDGGGVRLAADLEAGMRQRCALNFYEPAAASAGCVSHHPIFLAFHPSGLRDDYEVGHVVDFLGVPQPADYFLELLEHFHRMCTTTRIAAARSYKARSAVAAPWPTVDEEYFQHVDMLMSVVDAWHAGSQSFTVVELGSSFFAPWASKAVAAWRRLVPGGACYAGLAEIEEDKLQTLRGGLERLGLASCETRLWSDDVKVVGLEAMLEGFPTAIDYLDMDIEGGELGVIRGARAFLQQRVRRIHIGTHSRIEHHDLERVLRDDGWEIIWSYPPRSYLETPFGPVAFLDGVLAALSPDERWRRAPSLAAVMP